MTNEEIAKKIPEYVRRVSDRLYSAGEEAYIVGGSLRDIMLGTEPHDFDLASSAKPERVMEIFSDMRVIATGLQHGTVTVISEGHPLEITTFRIDGSYTDSRHPDSVSFTSRIEDDLSRRDFTVNAMAFSEHRGLVDPFFGRDDLKAAKIRAVGEPERRFSEDALRIMRAFRFSAQLGFSIDEATLEGAARCRRGLLSIARERISAELIKLLTSDSPEGALRTMRDREILSEILSGYVPEDRVLSLICDMPKTDFARLGIFLCSAEEGQAREILRSLRCSNKQITGGLAVRRGAFTSIETKADARRFIASCGAYFEEAARASVLMGSSPRAALAWVRENNSACTLSELEIGGRDLAKLGIGGKEIGRILDRLLERVIEDPELNRRELLIELAEKMKEEKGNLI